MASFIGRRFWRIPKKSRRDFLRHGWFIENYWKGAANSEKNGVFQKRTIFSAIQRSFCRNLDVF
jgi:hypothetical protein